MSLSRSQIVLYPGMYDDGPPPGDPNCKMCLFEAYNYLISTPAKLVREGSEHVQVSLTDRRPDGVSAVIYMLGMELNDHLPDASRQALTRYLPNGISPFARTANNDDDEIRRFMLSDWIVRVAVPIWLDAAGLTEHAASLRNLPAITPSTKEDWLPGSVNMRQCYSVKADVDRLLRRYPLQVRLIAARQASRGLPPLGSLSCVTVFPAVITARQISQSEKKQYDGPLSREEVLQESYARVYRELEPTSMNVAASALELFDAIVNVGK